MALNDTSKNLMLTELASVALYMSLHSAYPANSGNEITGGTPAYARKSITWGTAATGEIAMTNDPVFDVPASTVAAVGFWSAATVGTQYGDYDVTNEIFAAQGTYTVTAATINLNA